MPSKRNGDVGVFWRHGIGSLRQSLRQQAQPAREVQLNIKGLSGATEGHAADRA